ncbi:MAG: aquaporin [Acidobacteriia bacterium]|nr:aquaporin [Terriglobia bacterium]
MRTSWTLFVAEFVGTALLVAAGVSLVILDFGTGSPVVAAVPAEALRRLLTGFGFGCVGALIAISPIGKTSGAHINPIVTLSFWLNGTMRGKHAAAYAAAQLAGGVAGGFALLAWGPMGASVRFGATVPGSGFGPWVALLGEAATTMALILGLFVFLGHRRLRPFTPLLFPVLYAVMVWLEAPVSGTSTNPARTLGPAVVAGAWNGWWVYVVGPVAGALLGFGAHRLTWLRCLEVEVSKLYHFGHDPHGVLCRDRRWR